jgi:hypothetical protein
MASGVTPPPSGYPYPYPSGGEGRVDGDIYIYPWTGGPCCWWCLPPHYKIYILHLRIYILPGRARWVPSPTGQLTPPLGKSPAPAPPPTEGPLRLAGAATPRVDPPVSDPPDPSLWANWRIAQLPISGPPSTGPPSSVPPK